MKHFLSKLAKLTPRRTILLMSAATALAGASLTLKLVRFQRIATWLSGRRSRVLPFAPDLELIDDIGWAVRAAARRAPFRAMCLEQALAAAVITHGLRIPATLYLGVAHSSSGSLEAHAWLRAHSRILTGALGHERFRVVATFAPRFCGKLESGAV